MHHKFGYCAIGTKVINSSPLSLNRSIHFPSQQVHAPVPTQTTPETATPTTHIAKPRNSRVSPHVSGKTII